MKKFFAIALAAASFTQPAFAHSGETTNTKAAKSFSTDFKGADGVWGMRNNLDEVLFFWHNTLMDAYYDKDGELVGTFHQVETNALPNSALKNLSRHFRKYHITYASEMEKPGQESVYYATVQSTRHMEVLEISSEGEVKVFKSLK